VISRYQYYGRVVGHFDQPVDPEVPFLYRGLIGREVAVDHKEINARLDGICDKPFQALSGVGEVAVLIEMKITGVSKSQGHGWPPFISKHQCVLLLMGNGEAEEDRQLKKYPFEVQEACGSSAWPT
jgi:hypothetical protein